jgi:hypothetical protein
MKRLDGAFQVYEILPDALYQRGKLHRLSDAVKAQGVDDYGLTHAVALAPPTPDPTLGQFLRYSHHPMPDGLFKVGPFLLGLAAQLAEEIELGGRVVTMCNAGRNRSGLLSALIVRELSGVPGSAAMEFVRHQRPNALANPHFEAFLRSLP